MWNELTGIIKLTYTVLDAQKTLRTFPVTAFGVNFPSRPGETALQMEGPNIAKVCGQGRL